MPAVATIAREAAATDERGGARKGGRDRVSERGEAPRERGVMLRTGERTADPDGRRARNDATRDPSSAARSSPRR